MDMRCHLGGREGDSIHLVSDKILEMLVGIDIFVRTSEVYSRLLEVPKWGQREEDFAEEYKFCVIQLRARTGEVSCIHLFNS